jgi:hypothetical protein
VLASRARTIIKPASGARSISKWWSATMGAATCAKASAGLKASTRKACARRVESAGSVVAGSDEFVIALSSRRLYDALILNLLCDCFLTLS